MTAVNPTIEILVFEPGKPPEQRSVSHTLQALQELVGGYIEVIQLRLPGAQHLVTVCNEDGLLLGLPPNRGLVGTWFVCRTDGTEFASLTEHDLQFVLNGFATH